MICCILIIVANLRINKIELSHNLIVFRILVVAGVLALTLIRSLYNLSGTIFFRIFIFNVLLWLVMVRVLRLEVLVVLEIAVLHDTIQQD